MPESEMTQNLFLYGRPVSSPPEERLSPEAELVVRVCAGDSTAFSELYAMFAPLVHGILLARVPYDDVKDLVQDVFLAAYKNLSSLRDKSSVGPWLARIARNQAAEYYRYARPSVELLEEVRGRHNPMAEANEILGAIRTLPDSYRETLILRLIEGMTGNEIAERTGLKPESVRVNLHRGMELLRKKLGISGVKR